MSEEIRPQFGNRLMNEESDVFKHNAWDRVEWDTEQEEEANQQIKKQFQNSGDYESRYSEARENASSCWNAFYEKHESKFFKDRAWLFTEFSRLNPKNSPNLTVLEVGCGNGSNVIPLIEASKNCENYKIFGCDFAPKSVEMVQENLTVKNCKNRVKIFLHDLASDENFPEEVKNVDCVICTFVLSAIPKERMKNAILKMVSVLAPGGQIFFRDYGRHDLAQLRFKPNRVVGDNFYARGDGTLVYFYTENEIEELFDGCELIKTQIWTDRRLQVNRAKRLKMYRVWIQAIYTKQKS